jgi:monomeric isocitrate dehydrogenase
MPEIIYMKKSEYDKMSATKLREKYLKKTPIGYSKKDIMSMSDKDILDMDYFLNEEVYDFYDDDEDDVKEPDVIYHLIDDSPPDDFDDNIPF